MTTSTTYPNGQVLVSSALTVAAINAALQTLTCGMIGINPPDFSLVRVDWQTEGQPFENANVDICYLACVPKDEAYSRVRDKTLTSPGPGTGPVTENWLYTKGWEISWTLYGPNSEDRARMIRSAFFMDYFNDALSAVNLYPVNEPAEVRRAPELINGQWFERADFSIVMYEQVIETIEDGAATSVEIKINDKSGQLADFTVSES
jgi:hypothetical protein